MTTQLITSLEAMSQTLRRGTAVNVNDRAIKEQAITLAQTYFTEVRPSLVRSIGEIPHLLHHDRGWQLLVRLAHGNNARKSYLRVVSDLRRSLTEFNIQALTEGSINSQRQPAQELISAEENLLLTTLERLVPSAATSYRQGLQDLAHPRLSYRGTATEFREALRETLDHLAPNDLVAGQPGFKLEAQTSKPTTKQRVSYVLSSRGRNKTQRAAAERTVSLIEELAGEVTRAVYSHASLAAHVQQSLAEVKTIKRYIDTVLYDLLEISR